LFAAAEGIELELQGRGIVAPQLLQMLPYLVCLVALGLSRQSFRPPEALGR
jgi:ABC-type uncharacterized transport system permease subunit